MNLPDPARNPRGLATAFLAATFALTLAATASSESSYWNTWKAIYPNSLSDDNVLSGTGTPCQLCHATSNGGNSWNTYGWKVRELMNTMSVSAAIQAAEPFDSDLDPTGSDNLTEIDADAQPGWTTGANNTLFFKNGSTQSGTTPPAIVGDLDPPACSVTTYCTASTTSLAGCVAAISSTGTPSVSSPAGFQISSGAVPGGNVGLMYYSDKGRASIPFGTQGGFICVTPGFRSKPKLSGGTKNVCNGDYTFSLADLIQTGSSIITAGNTIDAAMWFRDPSGPDGFALSDGIEFILCP